MVYVCDQAFLIVYNFCNRDTNETINLIKEIPIGDLTSFRKQLYYRGESPIRTPVTDPRIWQNETEFIHKLYNKNELVMSTTAKCLVVDGMFCVDRVWYFGDGTEIPLPEYKYQRYALRNERLFKYGTEYRAVNIVTKKVSKPTRRLLVSLLKNKRSVPSELRIKMEQSYFACLGGVRMPTKYPVDDHGLQYDMIQEMYLFANGSPCSFTQNAAFISCNGNWILFQKDSVKVIIDSLHFTERIIDPAPIRGFVDPNGRLIEYNYKYGCHRDYATKEPIKHKLSYESNRMGSFHEKYYMNARDNHIEFWMDNEQIARRYVRDCNNSEYIYFNKGIVYTSEGQYNVNNCAQQQLIVLCTIVNSDIALYVSQFLLL
jgi:hypothetical protein